MVVPLWEVVSDWLPWRQPSPPQLRRRRHPPNMAVMVEVLLLENVLHIHQEVH